MMQKTGLMLCSIVLLLSVSGLSHAGLAEFERLYGEVLESYWRPAVTIRGVETTVFDYALMTRDARKPGSLFEQALKAIEGVDSTRLQNPNEAKAFWINAYNFAAMRLIVDHYPVDSIRSLSISLIKYPWSKKAIRIGNTRYSLKEIEKDILLGQFNDPRIVFTVSCAAVSCPDRTAKPFSAQMLENPGKGLSLDRSTRTLTLSWILNKDRQLFQSREKGVLDFILPYLDKDTREWLEVNPVEISYFEHDWTLNDLAQAN